MPIRFTCPHCGNVTDVAEKYAGQTGPCVECSKPITIPLLFPAPMHSGQPEARTPRSKSSTLLLILVIVLPILLCCCGIIAAVLIPSIKFRREATQITNCQINLQRISAAMQAYYDQNGHYPPAYVADKDGKPMHSWRVLLLPYLGEQALFDQYNMEEPWNGLRNRRLANRMPAVFLCPSEPNPAPNFTNYAMLVGPKAFSNGSKGRTKQEMVANIINMIAIAETTDNKINWLEPRDLDIETMTCDLSENDGQEMSSNHPNVVNVLYANGSVRILIKYTDSNIIKSMTTIDGNAQVVPGVDIPVE